MSDDELKFIALLVAVEDRRRHNITDMPALSNVEFRSSFTAGRGATRALENNADLISAAETARRNVSHLIGPGCPFERTLASTTVTVSVDAGVGDTHARDDVEVTTVPSGKRGPASMSLDVDPTTPDRRGPIKFYIILGGSGRSGWS